MKKRIVELLKKKKIAAGLTAVVLAVAVGGVAVVQQNQIPELPSYTDPVMETTIAEEETPLASQPKVNTRTSKSTSTKKVKMKKAAKRLIQSLFLQLQQHLRRYQRLQMQLLQLRQQL